MSSVDYRGIMLNSHERFAIHLLHHRGHSIRDISHVTGHDRTSIRHVLRDDPGAPVRKRRARRNLLESFRTQLVETLNKGPVCARALLADLRQQGYKGSRRTLQRFLHEQRAKVLTTREQEHEWMRMVLQGAIEGHQAKAAFAGGTAMEPWTSSSEG